MLVSVVLIPSMAVPNFPGVGGVVKIVPKKPTVYALIIIV
jgi:hypothetical protein